MSDSENKPVGKLIPWWFWLFFFAMAVTWWKTPELVSWMGGKEQPKSSGEFGDQYGVLNALFSGLAFLGVLVGIFIQGKEFRNQLREMTRSASEMKSQTDIYTQQLAEAKEQTRILQMQRDDEILGSYIPTLPLFRCTLLQNKTSHEYQFYCWIRNFGEEIYSLVVEVKKGGNLLAFEQKSSFLNESDFYVDFRKRIEFGEELDEDAFVNMPEEARASFFGESVSLRYVLRGGVECEEVFTLDKLDWNSCRRSQVDYLKSKIRSSSPAKIGYAASLFS